MTHKLIEKMERTIKKIWGVSLETKRTYRYNGYTLLDGTRRKGGTVTAKLPNNKKVKQTMEAVLSLLQAVGEEIIGDVPRNWVQWRNYVEQEYEKGRKDKKSKVIAGYQEWLYDKQRSRLKEIINLIQKV